MSNTTSTNEAVECNCWQLLGLTSTGNSVHEEVNNNHINIETREVTVNNTVTLNCSSNSNYNESTPDKVIQTTSELGTHQKIADQTVNMAKNSNNLNKFPFVQTNSDGIFGIEDLNIRSNHENKGRKGTNRNVIENKSTQLQNLTVLDTRQVNESMPPNDSPLDCSQIDKLLSHSERNKALIKSVLTSNKNAQSKLPADKSTLERILDIMKRESQNVETAEVTNADIFTQTEKVELKNKQTQAEFSNTYYSNCTIHMDVNCVNTKDFMRECKMYYEEYQQQMESLFNRHSREEKDKKHTFSNNNQVLLCDERPKSLSTGNNDKVDNNVSNRDSAVDSGHLATNTNNSRGVNTTSDGIHASNTVNNHNGTDTNNNDRVLNAVNPLPRRAPASAGEKATVVQLSKHLVENQVRAERPRNNAPNQRFAPYRQQTWQQMEYNARHRPTTPMANCQNVNAAHLQHNWMNRPFNPWQTPNLTNPQAFYTPHHHHHHQF